VAILAAWWTLPVSLAAASSISAPVLMAGCASQLLNTVVLVFRLMSLVLPGVLIREVLSSTLTILWSEHNPTVDTFAGSIPLLMPRSRRSGILLGSLGRYVAAQLSNALQQSAALGVDGAPPCMLGVEVGKYTTAIQKKSIRFFSNVSAAES